MGNKIFLKVKEREIDRLHKHSKIIITINSTFVILLRFTLDICLILYVSFIFFWHIIIILDPGYMILTHTGDLGLNYVIGGIFYLYVYNQGRSVFVVVNFRVR